MPESGLVQRAREWLGSTWHIQVPSNWLEACVDWVLRESGGGGAPVSQTHVNQQALEQWLLTDLRVLAHPVLPPLGGALKAELSGSFCVQMDSALDVSRPAYSQLQQRRGADCGNEQVSAATQATQRPWEAAPARVLMLQLTDGVQDLEALEYRPVPALSPDLPPGTKLLLQGRLDCRLGVLLLTPANVRVLGGAVEELRKTFSQIRVLSRALGLPEEEEEEEERAVEARAEERGPREEGVSDEELLESLEAVAADSGYGTRSEQFGSGPAAQPSVSPADEDFDDLPLDELDSVIFEEESDHVWEAEPDSVWEGEPELVEVEPRTSGVKRGPVEAGPEPMEVESRTKGVGSRLMAVEPKPMEAVSRAKGMRTGSVEVESSPVEVEPRAKRVGSGPIAVETGPRNVGPEPMQVEPRAKGVRPGSVEVEPTTRKLRPEPVDLESSPVEVEPRAKRVGSGPIAVETGARNVGPEPMQVEPRAKGVRPGSVEVEPTTKKLRPEPVDLESSPVEVEPRTKRVGSGPMAVEPGKGEGRSGVAPIPSGSGRGRGSSPGADRVCAVQSQSRAGTGTPEQGGAGWAISEASSPQGGPGMEPVSPPFTYLCVLARGGARLARVKAFIITLQGSLRSSSGAWQVSATISDGTGYLDARLSDGVLAGLIGFSVAESRALRRDPERQGLVPEGLQRCQRELVDMCCLMTLRYEPAASTVLSAEQVTADTRRELESRVRGRERR